jgi:hypothetical protein
MHEAAQAMACGGGKEQMADGEVLEGMPPPNRPKTEFTRGGPKMKI